MDTCLSKTPVFAGIHALLRDVNDVSLHGLHSNTDGRDDKKVTTRGLAVAAVMRLTGANPVARKHVLKSFPGLPEGVMRVLAMDDVYSQTQAVNVLAAWSGHAGLVDRLCSLGLTLRLLTLLFADDCSCNSSGDDAPTPSASLPSSAPSVSPALSDATKLDQISVADSVQEVREKRAELLCGILAYAALDGKEALKIVESNGLSPVVSRLQTATREGQLVQAAKVALNVAQHSECKSAVVASLGSCGYAMALITHTSEEVKRAGKSLLCLYDIGYQAQQGRRVNPADLSRDDQAVFARRRAEIAEAHSMSLSSAAASRLSELKALGLALPTTSVPATISSRIASSTKCAKCGRRQTTEGVVSAFFPACSGCRQVQNLRSANC